MWGISVSYAVGMQQGVKLSPLNMHYEGINLHEDIDISLPESSIIHNCTSVPLVANSDLIDPGHDYDFTHLRDTDKFYRGVMEYKRPCGWKRLAINVMGVYDGGNKWLSMKAVEGVWVNSYMPTDLKKVKEFIKTDQSFISFAESNYSYDMGIVSMPDVEVAARFAQIVKVDGVNYKFVIQNRVHPKAYHIICNGEALVCPKESIRPYGFIIKPE